MDNINKAINYNYKFDWITEVLKNDIIDLVNKNINGKVNWYLKKILEKKDSKVHIDMDIKKNKQEKYESSFRFDLDWKIIVYKNSVPFKNINDLINHAFDHLKREISDSK